MEPGTASSTLNRKSRSSGRGRFSNRVNRSSSMHDLARARLEPAADQSDLAGVKWKDEQRLPNIGMPGIGSNGRTLSSKSLAVMPGENIMWNNGGLQGGLQGGHQGGLQGGVQERLHLLVLYVLLPPLRGDVGPQVLSELHSTGRDRASENDMKQGLLCLVCVDLSVESREQVGGWGRLVL